MLEGNLTKSGVGGSQEKLLEEETLKLCFEGGIRVNKAGVLGWFSPLSDQL